MFNVASRPQILYGILGSPGQPPGLSHRSWALALCSFNVALCPQRQRPYGILESGSPGPNLDFHTAPELRSSVLLYVHRDPYGRLGSGSPGRPPRLSHSSVRALRPQRPLRKIRVGESRTATSTFTQLLSSVRQCCFTSTETLTED